MGYLQSLVGNCPGIPHWDCPAIWQPIPREEDEGDCCSLPSLPAITSRPTQGGGGVHICVCVRLTRLESRQKADAAQDGSSDLTALKKAR